MCPLLSLCLLTKALITFPNAARLLLILLLSSNLLPVAPVNLTLSDPARSTRLIFPTFIYLGQSSVINLSGSTGVIYSTIIIKTACDRLDTSFILVDAVILEFAPFFNNENISFGVLTAHSESPST